jgi:hypothetical protein
MKRFLLGGLAALGLAFTASPAKADCSFEYSCSRHLSYTHTSKSRCFSYSSHPNPLPCAGGGCASGPAMWDGLAAYGAAGYGVAAYAAPVAASPAAATPAATTPSFQAPQPKPATTSTSALQQAAYFYYGQSNNSGYGYNAGYNYGVGYYGYGSSNFQAPDYWYGN